MELALASEPDEMPEQCEIEDPRFNRAAEREIGQLLKMLPADVLSELQVGTIDLHDPAFLEGLTDHVSRLALANPQTGARLLGKLNRVKKLIRRTLRESDPDAKTSDTILRNVPRVGRNNPCPCGSGRKFKQCCLRRQVRK